MPGPQSTPPRTVSIIAHQATTTSSLAAYLDSMGVCTSESQRLTVDALPAAEAMVLFPDGFAADTVALFMTALRQQRPNVAMVLVTSRVQEFAPPPEPTRTAVLPRPSFAWGILEALRVLCAESASKAHV